MKILQFVADGSPGGGTNHVLQILQGLQDRHELGLLTEENSYLQKRAFEMGVRVFGGHFFRSRIDRKAARRAKDVFDKFSPDLVHSHGGRAAFFSSFAKPTNAKLIYTVHGFHFARKPSITMRTLGRLGESRNFRAHDHILFVCENDRAIAESTSLLPLAKSHQIILNGIPLEANSAPERDIEVGYCGRFVEQKNPELFVEMMEHLPDARAVMIGGGSLDRTVQKLAMERNVVHQIEFLGTLPHEEALKTIARMRVLVGTPRWEGLPLLCLEAMQLGTPIVSTSVGGIPEIITHGKDGYLVKERSPELLAKYTAELLADDELHQRISVAAHETVASCFNEEEMLNAIEKCYHDQLNQTATAVCSGEEATA